METTPLLAPLICRLRRQIAGHDWIADGLAGLAPSALKLPGRAVLYREEEENEAIFVLASGWLVGSTTMANGRRTIHRIYQAGDIVGLEDINWALATSTIQAVTPVSLGRIDKRRYFRAIATSAPLAMLFFGLSMNDHIVSVDLARANGRLTARDRIGHLLLQVRARQALTTDAPGPGFEFPFVQEQIADVVNLSVVQTNRGLRALRHEGSVRVARPIYEIREPELLRRRTQFVDRYVITNPDWLRYAS